MPSKGQRRGPRGRKGARQESDAETELTWSLADVQSWFTAKVDSAWFVEEPGVAADREEIQVVGVLAIPEGEFATSVEMEAACATKIAYFREITREARVEIAQVAEVTWNRKVSWGVRCGSRQELFTHASVPVMTRLRLEDRQVLDTLVAANVARSRSDALGWCVRQIAERDGDWFERLRGALIEVDRVRSEGSAGSDEPIEDA